MDYIKAFLVSFLICFFVILANEQETKWQLIEKFYKKTENIEGKQDLFFYLYQLKSLDYFFLWYKSSYPDAKKMIINKLIILNRNNIDKNFDKIYKKLSLLDKNQLINNLINEKLEKYHLKQGNDKFSFEIFQESILENSFLKKKFFKQKNNKFSSDENDVILHRVLKEKSQLQQDIKNLNQLLENYREQEKILLSQKSNRDFLRIYKKLEEALQKNEELSLKLKELERKNELLKQQVLK